MDQGIVFMIEFVAMQVYNMRDTLSFATPKNKLETKLETAYFRTLCNRFRVYHELVIVVLC